MKSGSRIQDASEEESPLIQTSFSMVLVTQILKALKFHTSAVCLLSKEGEGPFYLGPKFYLA